MLSFENFLKFAIEREPLIDEIKDKQFVRDCYSYAFNTASKISFYLDYFQVEAYCYNLSLHLIILTARDDNSLFKKYNPNNDEARLKNLGAIVGSVSDSTSSVSNIAYKGLQNLTIEDAMLMLTPYGTFCKTITDGLKNAIVIA